MRSNKRKFRKLFIIFAIIFITSVVLIYETYAWFVGITSVSVDQFTISVAAEGGLELSLDGGNWSSTSISINPNTIENINGNHLNEWPQNGLTPVSTDGQLDISTSKLKLYAKESLAATAGGYQIVSNKLTNSPTEKEGYIAFDLFIKNVESTGTPSATYDSSMEEDIFLTADSNVYAPTAGVNNEGLANSIRVGFFEIGRVEASSSQSTIRGISCSTSPSLCETSSSFPARRTYTWNIWEPNAAKHSTNLVNYFNQICKKRTGETTYSSDPCFPLEVGSSRNTYALNSETDSDDHVDVYDGIDVNFYNGTSEVSEMYTYKTSFATSSGSDKPRLLRVAGNSVTKVRVYIWLEGQDIDNYDLATQDSQLSINFGFTKDRYGLNEANVNNPSTGRASSFEDDSWAEIQANIRSNNTSQYKVGDTREIMINGHLYTLKLVNKTTNSTLCSNTSKSQTACGFVVEFTKVVEKDNRNVLYRRMNSSATNAGGWPGSELYAYLQGEFYNSLPSDLKEVITLTRVVSGYGASNSNNFITNDKLYLLNSKEIFGDTYVSTSTANTATRQLDYYSTTTGMEIKLHPHEFIQANSSYWWLRDPHSNNTGFLLVSENGGQSAYGANTAFSFYPAFRIA